MTVTTTALSALSAGGQALSTIGNNLANSGTVGYKTEEAMFSTIVSGNAGGNTFSSSAVQAQPIRNIGEQGLLAATSSNTDFAVSGNGFFVVGKTGDLATGAVNDFAFTRAGSFKPDKQGYLANASGYYLQGWPTDTDGKPIANNLNSLDQLQSVSVNQIAGITTPTSKVGLKLNLPAEIAVGGTAPTTIPVFNSLGEGNPLLCTWKKATNIPLVWNLTITIPNGTVKMNDVNGAAYTDMAVEFDGAGKPLKYNGVTNPPPNIFVTWNSAANPSTFTLNLGDLNTADGITCNAGPYSETLVTQDGNGPGQLTGIAMSEEGLVSAIFSNGQTLNIFLVPLANFAAPHKLSPGNGNVWTQTNASGSFLLATAKSAGMGSIMANSLEQSTVELAQQLTKMMEVERFYSSNVQVIKADENMFNDLKQLSR